MRLRSPVGVLRVAFDMTLQDVGPGETSGADVADVRLFGVCR